MKNLKRQNILGHKLSAIQVLTRFFSRFFQDFLGFWLYKNVPWTLELEKKTMKKNFEPRKNL